MGIMRQSGWANQTGQGQGVLLSSENAAPVCTANGVPYLVAAPNAVCNGQAMWNTIQNWVGANADAPLPETIAPQDATTGGSTGNSGGGANANNNSGGVNNTTTATGQQKATATATSSVLTVAEIFGWVILISGIIYFIFKKKKGTKGK